MRSRLACLALLFPLATPAFAQELNPIQRSILNIENMRRAFFTNRTTIIDPTPDVAVLTAAIRSEGLPPQGNAIVRYYRAIGSSLVNQILLYAGKQPDAAVAQQALADLEEVLTFGKDVPQVGITIGNAGYMAGSIARNELFDVGRAYSYWQRCAEKLHAGCLNIMADAYLTGNPFIRPDPQRAVEEHAKVYATGTQYTCAGAFSALIIGQVVHFGGVRADGDEIAWLQRASALQATAAKEQSNPDICSLARFRQAEYLMRLAKGEKRTELLREVQKVAEREDERAVAAYLLGESDEAALRALVAGTADKDRACSVHFTAMWRAEVAGDGRLAAEHLDRMKALGGDHCRREIALAGLRSR